MTVPSIKVKVVRRPQIKVKALVKFPANVVTQKFLTVTNSGGTYTFSVDYSLLGPGPVSDPTTAYVAINDTTAGVYRTVTLASLLTSGLDADLQAIAALTTTGILVRTASNTWVLRAVTGTANEITVTNGDGVAGAPTVSLPSALTFTGKTITGGTYTGAVSFNKVNIVQPATGSSIAIADGKTTGIANSLTFAGTDATTITFQGTDTYVGRATTDTLTGVKTFGSAGAVGRFKLAGTTSGSTILDATATASGTMTLPAATDTLVGKATTDILTNKTYDTAGAGNSFSINSLAATANTGTGAVVRATSPALVTPALGTPTALVLTSATGLPLSGLNTQAAFTFVGNNTSGTAVPTAVDIAALTSKASPAASDLVMISDQAASGAWKKVTVTSLASAGSVSSIAGNTGAFTLSTGITNSTNDIRLNVGQLPGETTTGNASAGNIGEYSTNTSGAIALTTAVSANTASVSLTAGDWDVSGFILFVGAASTTMTMAQASVSSVSATEGNFQSWFGGGVAYFSTVNGAGFIVNSPTTRFSLSATTTIYLVANTRFATSTLNGTGTIRARRAR